MFTIPGAVVAVSRLAVLGMGVACAAAAAVLADLSVGEVCAVLAGLARAHPAETAPGTGPVAIHDLLRLYARRLSDADDREQARDRLLGYYLTTADAADDHLRALPGTAGAGRFARRGQAPGRRRARTARPCAPRRCGPRAP